MDIGTKNKVICVGGKAGIMGLGVYFGSLLWNWWDKVCAKATAENRMVGEKNFDKAATYVEENVLPDVAQTVTDQAVQAVDRAVRLQLGEAQGRTQELDSKD